MRTHQPQRRVAIEYNLDTEAQLDLVFGALADRTRRHILRAVSSKSCTVSELAQPHNMSLPAISKHLKILERAGLLVKQKDGRVFRCNLNGAALLQAAELIDYYKGFWEQRFDALEKFISQTHPPKS